VRKLTVILLLIILPADSLYAMAEMYWAHRHSATHQKHAGHQHHRDHAAGSGAVGGHISLHGQNGSWDCPIFQYVSGMAVTLPSSVFYPASAAQYPQPVPSVVIFRSFNPAVPQHRDKHVFA
jgi:hypothetical protein